MTKNVGNFDRILRIVVAIIAGYLLFTKTVLLSSFLGIVLAVVGVIFLFTGLLGWCAIYALLGVKTCPSK